MGAQVSVRGEDAPGERVIKPASVGIECERACTAATRRLDERRNGRGARGEMVTDFCFACLVSARRAEVEKRMQLATCDHTLPASSLRTAQGLEKVWEATDRDGT